MIVNSFNFKDKYRNTGEHFKRLEILFCFSNMTRLYIDF